MPILNTTANPAITKYLCCNYFDIKGVIDTIMDVTPTYEQEELQCGTHGTSGKLAIEFPDVFGDEAIAAFVKADAEEHGCEMAPHYARMVLAGQYALPKTYMYSEEKHNFFLNEAARQAMQAYCDRMITENLS